MAVRVDTGGDAPVTFDLFNDFERIESQISVTPPLAKLLAYAHEWARQEDRNDPATLTFSSTLAAMVAGEHPLCAWLRLQLALRGSPAEAVTKKRRFPHLSIPTTRLTTTTSFRRACAKAQALAGPVTLDVRHFMAAYPVVKDYHAADFLRFRIDRRVWCLALAEHLQRVEPTEAAQWRQYAALAPEVLLPTYRPDVPSGIDLLGVGREVEAFSMLIAAAQTVMPLSIGVFGAWGSGKSFFMTRLEERVATLSQGSEPGGKYLQRIAQVRFNAWHYSEGDVVSSLVDHILRNLRFGPTESDVVLARRRAAALAQVEAADRDRQALQQEAVTAAAEESRLRDAWKHTALAHEAQVREASGKLAQAQAAVIVAEEALRAQLREQQNAVDDARRRAPAQAATELFTDTVLKDPKLAALRDDVERVRQEAKWLGANRFTIALGVFVVANTALAALVIPQLRDSPIVTALTAVILAAAPFAAQAMTLLRQLSSKGADFQAAVQKRASDEITRISAEGAQALREREAAVTAARASVDALRSEVTALTETARQAQDALAAAVQQREQAAQELAAATAAADAARRRLDALTVGSLLGDTIQEAGDTDVFRAKLGTLSFARNYFQRLSETMKAARLEAAAGSSARPELERVVLYIDDLDRCPKSKVREVLRAVHLLLAFDLFACVVAVDPRWIIECLQKSPGVNQTKHGGNADLDVLGGVTTPSDYLEKIIQIPLWLRPVPADRRAALATTLLQSDDLAPQSIAGARDRGIGAAEDDRAAANAIASSDDEVGLPPSAGRDVRITPQELDFLSSRVAPLLDGNSRALKRFVNTYQLVKASLSEVEFDSFANETKVQNHHPYRVCMAQLALLGTQRERARLLAKAVDDAPLWNDMKLGAWLDVLEAQPDGYPSIARDLASVLLPEMRDLPFDRFSGWFERTRRYSFYV